MTQIKSPLWADNWKGQGKELAPEIKEVLKNYAGKTIGELKRNNDGLILYPPPSKDNKGEDFEKQCLFTGDGEEAFHTTNVMGVISLPAGEAEERLTLAIGSRFDVIREKGPDEKWLPLNRKQPFLTYLLAQSLDLHVSNWKIQSTDKNFNYWLLLTALLWAFHLREALRKGILKVYVNRRANDERFQGAFDISRHIKQNTPFVGKVAYRYREHSADNPVLHLIRAAGERARVELGPLWQFVIGDPDVRRAFAALEEITPSYQGRDIRRLVLSARPVRHPYYSEYEELRKLSVRLLLGEGEALYGEKCSDGQIYGILFNGAWLWERYLARVLGPLGFHHCEKETVRFLTGPKFIPDFINYRGPEKDGNNASWILDAKYKDWSGNRDDIHQVLSYMYLTGATRGGVIYPKPSDAGDKAELIPKLLATPRRHEGAEAEYWYEIALPVPQGVDDVFTVHKQMKITEEDLRSKLSDEEKKRKDDLPKKQSAA